MTSPLARPESLNRYAYVVNSPATLADPSGNFILAADCFLDAALFPECQCDPENGCPPVLLLLLPAPVKALSLGAKLKRVLKQLGDFHYCADHTGDLKHCGLCCDEANAAHGLICTALLTADPAGPGEILADICYHLSTDWALKCAEHCRDEH